MSILDKIKDELTGDENSIEDNSLPWTIESKKNTNEDSSYKSISTKKIALIGISVLIITIVSISLFNYFNNSTTLEIKNESSTESKDETAEIKVHVAGEVKKPGLYKLKYGSRIFDAIEAAGGFTENADKDALNLAKTIEDGEQIIVNSKIAQQPETSQSSTNNGKININTADLATLQTITGIGPSTAQKIIDYRNSNGKFKSINDLKKVSGIGDKTFEKLKDKICV